MKMLQHPQRQSRRGLCGRERLRYATAPQPSPWPWYPVPKTSVSPPGAGGTDPSAGDTQSPNTLIACANDTLGRSNATQGSAGPASPGTAVGPAAGGLILHPDQGSACIPVCCTQESQLFFFGISCNFPFLLGEISRNDFLPSPSVFFFFFLLLWLKISH